MVENLSAEEGRRPPLRGAEVTERIKAFILQNELQPGDALPTEATLCSELGASRSSVREAIKTLSALDIVDVRHGHGTYVGKLSMAALLEGLTFKAMLSSQDDFAVLSELVEVRQLLEQGLAQSIVAAFDENLNRSLSELVDQMRLLADSGEPFVDQDRSFHLLLMQPLQNHLVGQLTTAFWDIQAIVAPLLDSTTTDVQETVDAHAEIVRAAASGDTYRFINAIADHYAPVRRQLRTQMTTAPR